MATWQKIQNYLAWIEGDLRAGTPYETQDLLEKYSKAQRLVSRMVPARNPIEKRLMRNGVMEIAREHELTVRQAFFLLRRLNRLRGSYEMGHHLQRETVPSEISDFLTELRRSAQRIGELGLSTRSRERDARQHLTEAVKKHIRTLPKADSEAAGIVLTHYRTPEGDFAGDNVPGLIDQWFKLALIVDRATASEIARQSQREHGGNPWKEGPTPIVNLIGGELPKVYEAFSGKKFKRVRKVEPKKNPEKKGLQMNAPMRFALSCLKVMDLKVRNLHDYKPETVSSYVDEYRRAKKSQKSGRTRRGK